MSTSTACRYVQQVVALLTAPSPKLTASLRKANKDGLHPLILDATVIRLRSGAPTGRCGDRWRGQRRSSSTRNGHVRLHPCNPDHDVIDGDRTTVLGVCLGAAPSLTPMPRSLRPGGRGDAVGALPGCSWTSRAAATRGSLAMVNTAVLVGGEVDEQPPVEVVEEKSCGRLSGRRP